MRRMKKDKHTRLEVEYWGGIAPRVDCEYGYIMKKYDDVAIIVISTKEKRPQLSSSFWGSNGDVGIELSCQSEKYKGIARVHFPEFAGWSFLCGTTDRYSYIATLTKD